MNAQPAPVDLSEFVQPSDDEDWRDFSESLGSLNIPRASMPQIKSEHRGAMVQYLKGRGITHSQEMIAPDTLKPSQAEYSPAKVERARSFEGPQRSILISSDDYVLDGHHQWLSALADAPDEPYPAIRFNAPINQLLVEAARFPSSGVDESSKDTVQKPAAPSPAAPSAPAPVDLSEFTIKPDEAESAPDLSEFNQRQDAPKPAPSVMEQKIQDAHARIDQARAALDGRTSTSVKVDDEIDLPASMKPPAPPTNNPTHISVALPVEENEMRMTDSQLMRRAFHSIARAQGIPDDFTREWLDGQEQAGKLKLYDLKTKQRQTAQDVFRSGAYDPETKQATLNVEMPMVRRLAQDYENSKGYFEKIGEVISDPNMKPGEKFFFNALPMTAEVVTRPVRALSTAVAGAQRGLATQISAGLGIEGSDEEKGLYEGLNIPRAALTTLTTGETPEGYEQPIAEGADLLYQLGTGHKLPWLARAAVETVGDPVNLALFEAPKLPVAGRVLSKVNELVTGEDALSLGRAITQRAEKVFASGGRVLDPDNTIARIAVDEAGKAGVKLPVTYHPDGTATVEIDAPDGSGKLSVRLRPTSTATEAAAAAPSFKENIYSALSVPRAIKTSADLSAPRQGAFLAAGHPVRAAQAFGEQFKSFFSQRAAQKTMEEIAGSPLAAVREKAGLFLPDLEDSSLRVGAREEAYGSRLTKRIPLVNRSERAFNVFLNKLRADVFDDIVTSHPGITDDELKLVADGINKLTGRGSLGWFENHGADVAQVLFAPRLLASRLQSPLLLASKSPVVRREAARSLSAFVGANLGFLGLVRLAGAQVELDPRSTDFLRARFGNTRVDLTEGVQPMARYTAQLLMGQKKNLDTGEIEDSSRFQTAKRMVRTRLAPQLSMPIDYLSGKNVAGEPLSLEDAEPLAIRDLVDAVRDDRRSGHSGARGAALGALSLLGAGVSTYRSPAATAMQMQYVRSLGATDEQASRILGRSVKIDDLTRPQARKVIEALKKK